MSILTLRSASLALVLGATSMLQAQSPVDVGIFANDGRLEVRVRPTVDFDGIFSSVVFTLRWDRSANVQLGDAVQPEGPRTYIPISAAGAVREGGSYNYQVFAGFGFEPMRNMGTSWTAGQEYTVLTIPFTGDGVVELVNDSWTGETQNNADYYLSLGGMDRTGTIFQKSINASEVGAVTILPNPNDGQFVFSFAVGAPADIQVEVVNALGQSMFTEQLRGFEGTYRKEMDLRTSSNGVYYLKITRNGTTDVHKIVYR